jgi:hypothetical protein
MDAEIYQQLMDDEYAEVRSNTGSDSLLQSSSTPWNNSFTRQETDLVIATFRKESYNSSE